MCQDPIQLPATMRERIRKTGWMAFVISGEEGTSVEELPPSDPQVSMSGGGLLIVD